ncbi:MAG: transcriptional regulator [Gemmatimonadales bacterium]|nr:MAG: transcriptional regulator [Gemmatimonadales bacterium]
MVSSGMTPDSGSPPAPAPPRHAHGAPEHAHGVDPEIRERNLTRLRRIEGQVRGIHRMVAEDRYCPDILVQISSIQEALRGVSREVMRNHLAHCAADAEREGGDAAERMRDELLDLVFKYLR